MSRAIHDEAAKVVTRLDIQTNVIYVGYATRGSTASDVGQWVVKKITLVGGSPTAVEWTDGPNTSWDNRAAATYG